MAPYISKQQAAARVGRTVKTIENWIGHGYITGYRDAPGSILVNLEELETALKQNSRMRDGRRTYGKDARIVPVIVHRAEVVSPLEGSDR
ncbi:hypothetical protein [Agromyces sp. SYSU T0242]|uniref:hypothetical protein n=1 Tax=Agromyces litoreus TaxID=3158561 RepID=UPI00339530A3